MQDKRKRLLQWHPALFSGLQIELSEETNLWLKSLTNDLKSDRAAERLLHAYEKHRTEGLYQSVMDVVIRANEERFMVSDMREMCEALDELLDKRAEIKAVKLAEAKGMEQGLSRGLSQGLSQGLLQGKQQKLLDLIRKKIEKGRAVAQIADELEESEEAILPLYNQLKKEWSDLQKEALT